MLGVAPYFAIILGALLGSFLNVVISRVPAQIDYAARQTDRAEGEPGSPPPPGIAWPGSHCPACKHPIRIRDNIPIISWLMLRGRCRDCSEPIPLRYPVTELFTAIITAVVVLRFGIGDLTLLLPMLLLSWWLIAMAVIDLETRLLPDALTLSGLWLGLLFSVSTGFISPTMAIIGAAVGYASLWLINTGYVWLRGHDGLGYGDFKLFAMIGAWGGVETLLATSLIAPICALLIAVAQIPRQGFSSRREMPFGPYLALGGWIAIMAPPSIAVWLPPWAG
ncbi:prepilin peptidase [Spiribacter insolitus]|uniref:Prepilin leader peptidase/N-methyltransferase n=1 Tax=Spiribacter insolitus TaxID=3122417 RepID=A0ABV3T7I6_9GAMM